MYNIVQGTLEDLNLDSREWLIVDLGYSRREPSNAIWRSDGILRSMFYSELRLFVVESARRNSDQPLHLAIEAPLSAAFTVAGEPTTRPCDEWQGPGAAGPYARPWFTNAGATTLLLAEFLLRDLHEDNIGPRRILLYEGHVSFRYGENHRFRFPEARNRHEADVLAIRYEIEQGLEANLFDEDRLRRE